MTFGGQCLHFVFEFILQTKASPDLTINQFDTPSTVRLIQPLQLSVPSSIQLDEPRNKLVQSPFP